MKQFALKTQIYRFDRFAEFAKDFAIKEDDLLITQQFIYDPFIKALGLPCHVLFQEKYGGGEPTDEMTDAIVADLSNTSYSRVIAVGGGTVIDIGKVLSLKKFDRLTQLYDEPERLARDKELIIVPTTCGTGSEVTNISIFALLQRGTKMGIANDALYADYAVMIPELISTLPYRFFLYSSIDALVHSLESFLSPKSTGYTELFAVEAFTTILNSYRKLAERGEAARGEIEKDVLIASNFAGIAFGNSGVGAVHAMSYPLGGNYHVAHGESNYQFLCAVFEAYYSKKSDGKIQDLCRYLSRLLDCPADSAVFVRLDELLGGLIAKKRLREYGMKEAEIAAFAQAVIDGQQRLLANNYVPFSQKEIEEIYRKLY